MGNLKKTNQIIYCVSCLTEKGEAEYNGYFFNKKNAVKLKVELDRLRTNVHYNIKQCISKIEIGDNGGLLAEKEIKTRVRKYILHKDKKRCQFE